MYNEQNDPDVWGALYEKATNVAAEFDIIPSRLRRAGRQNHRANPDVDTVSDYWRITLFNVFLDDLIQVMETRILSKEYRFAAQYPQPNRLPGLQDEMLPSIYVAYAPDLQHTFEAFGNKVARSFWTRNYQRLLCSGSFRTGGKQFRKCACRSRSEDFMNTGVFDES